MYFFKNTFVTFNEMETNYFGIVTLTSIENIRPSNDTSNEKTATDDLMDESRVRLVHYPDCQQLIIWLPVDGIHYLDMVICDQKTKDEIWRKDIREIINGTCLLYTSDAADERSSVDLGGRRIIKKKITRPIIDSSMISLQHKSINKKLRYYYTRILT